MYFCAVDMLALIHGLILSLFLWTGGACVDCGAGCDLPAADAGFVAGYVPGAAQELSGVADALSGCRDAGVGCRTGFCGGREFRNAAPAGDSLAECGGVSAPPVRVPGSAQRHSAQPRPSTLIVKCGKLVDSSQLSPFPTLPFVSLSIGEICGRYLYLICRLRM